jgi:GTP1/Obg family GTP-binding protein
LILDLLRTLRLNLGENLDDVFSKLPSEYTDFEKCAAIISIRGENEKLRDELYTIIGRNPLLINRIFSLMKKLHSAANILETIEVHKKRIRWHLQRIYRARNLITHKGEKIFYVEQLVENLHDYYHTILDLIQVTRYQNKHIDSLETVFNLIRIEHESHMRILKESKEESCNDTNFKLLLFGN